MQAFTKIFQFFSFLLFLRNAVCSAANSTTSSVFVFDSASPNSPSSQAQFTFALNIAINGDVYFHMSSPSGNAWMGVGVGDQMGGSLMFIAYPSANGTGMTISPRVAQHGQSEPTYYPGVQCESISGAETTDTNNVTSPSGQALSGYMVADAVCHNATTWSSGYMHLQSTAQPFIFAVGPANSMQSDSLSANLNRHSLYGHFTMDLTQATSLSGASVPQPNGSNGAYVTNGASQAGDTKKDNSFGPGLHASLMCLAFLVVFPLGSLLARMVKRIMVHAIVQELGFLFTTIAFGVGIYIGLEFNRSRHFQSAHQVMGLMIFCVLLIQVGLGLTHHRQYKKTQQPTKFRKVHVFLGPIAIIFGLINGGLGFSLSGNTVYIFPYIALIILVGLIYTTVRSIHACFSCWKRRKSGKDDGPEGYQYPQFDAYQPPPYAQSMPLQNYPKQPGMPQVIVHPKPTFQV